MKQTSDKLEFQEMSFASWFQLLLAVNLLVFGLFSGLFSGSFFAYLLIGLLLVIFVEIDTITFDKNLGHMTIKRHKPLLAKMAKTAKTKVVKHLIQDISGVEIQEMTSSDSNNLYRVCLVLKSDKGRVPLTSYFSADLGNKHKKAEVIANFLDIRNYGLGGFPSQESSSQELQ